MNPSTNRSFFRSGRRTAGGSGGPGDDVRRCEQTGRPTSTSSEEYGRSRFEAVRLRAATPSSDFTADILYALGTDLTLDMGDQGKTPTEREGTAGPPENVTRIAACEELIGDSALPDYGPGVWRLDQWERELYAASDSEENGESDGTSTLVCLDHDELDGGVQVSPEIAVVVQLFEPGERTEKHRHNTPAINFVVRGSGYSVVDGERIEWDQYDTFLVPAWDYHRHVNDGDEDAILYTTQPIPLQRQLRSQMWQEGEGEPIRQLVRERER